MGIIVVIAAFAFVFFIATQVFGHEVSPDLSAENEKFNKMSPEEQKAHLKHDTAEGVVKAVVTTVVQGFLK